MQIKQILEQKSAHKLSNLDLELLIALVLKQDRAFILAHLNYELSINQGKKIEVLIKKRLSGYPYAYLSGQKEFYGLNFKVNQNTLIPRPETELIIDYILDKFKDKILSVIDVGTGSGCIIISLAKNLKAKDLAESNKYLALDISVPALKTAKLNAKNNGLGDKIKFKKSDLLSGLLGKDKTDENLGAYLKSADLNRPLLITANLPYLTPAQIKNSPSLKYEPRRALEAGYDGLKYYKKILPQILELLNLGFKEITIIFEIDPGQNQTLSALIHKTFAKYKLSLQTKNDLAELNRFLILNLDNK